LPLARRVQAAVLLLARPREAEAMARLLARARFAAMVLQRAAQFAPQRV
jgi:hypothetical protein